MHCYRMLGSFAGRRGRPAGHAAGRLAGPRRVRGARLDAHLALPDRHQPLPQRAARGQPAPGQGVGRARRRPARADPARRGRLARAVSRRPPRGRGRRAARPGGPLRADRVHLAGLRDRAAGPAAPPGRRAHPARRPRVPRQRGGRHARHDRRLGHQRPQAGARQPAAPPAAAAGRRSGARLTRRGRARGEVRPRVRVRRSRRAGGPADRRRLRLDAADAVRVRRPGRRGPLLRQPVRRGPPVRPGADPGQRPAGVRDLPARPRPASATAPACSSSPSPATGSAP